MMLMMMLMMLIAAVAAVVEEGITILNRVIGVDGDDNDGVQ